MGFGRGPFGKTLFGRSSWARAVLFDSLPTIYREYDAENDNVLETLVSALEPTFELARERIENWADLRDPLRVRSTSDTAQSIRLGLVKEPDSRTEQRGADGFIGVQRRFQSPSARFRSTDQGKTLILSGSGILANNQKFKIASVLSSNSVTCDPPLIVDSGPLRWELKSFPDFPEGEIAIEVRGGDVLNITPGWQLSDGETRFTITHRQQFFPMPGETRLLTEREGVAGQVLLDGRFQAETAFTQKDVGKPLTLAGSATTANNGKFQIREVDASAPTCVKLWESLTVEGANANGGLVYSLQPGSGVVRVTHEANGAFSALVVGVRNGDITVSLATDANGLVTSRASDVASLLSASSDVLALVTVSATGTGAGLAGTTGFVTLPGASLSPEAGPLFWALLPFPEIRIQGQVPPAGIIQRENVDLTVNGNQVSTLTGKFTTSDIGNLLVLAGSLLGSNGVYSITAVANASTCTISTSLPSESNLAWAVRTPSLQASVLDVQAAAPSLLENLAADFALTIDERESEDRQRSWIENSVQWMDLKGTDKAYQLISAISGFNATSLGLFRVPRGTIDAITATNRVIIGENGTGRVGVDGFLYTSGKNTLFTAKSAVFAKRDVGLSFYFRNTNNSVNEGLFEISGYVDAQTVILDPKGSATAPDYGIGGSPTSPRLAWRLCRLYSSRSPSRPRYDDLNVELMQTIVGPDHFRMDSFSWDPAFLNSFTIGITNVTPPEVPGVPIFYTVELTGMPQASSGNYSTARVINNPGTWQLTDASGQVFSIETLPIQTSAGPPEVYTLEVFSGEIPVAGSATLTYLGDDSTSCDFCRSNVALVRLTPGALLGSSTSEINTALDIANTRLMTEIRPAHVTLVPAYLDGTTAAGTSLNPNYVLLEYALASNLADAVDTVDQLYVIKNDTNLIDTGTDPLLAADTVAFNIYRLFQPSSSDSLSVTDSLDTVYSQWDPSLLYLTGWARNGGYPYHGAISGNASAGPSGSRSVGFDSGSNGTDPETLVNTTSDAGVGYWTYLTQSNPYPPPILDGDGGGGMLGAPSDYVSATGYSGWVLFRSGSTDGLIFQYSIYTGFSTSSYVSGGSLSVSISHAAGGSLSFSGLSTNVWHLFQFTFGSGTLSARVDGGSWSTTSAGALSPSTVPLPTGGGALGVNTFNVGHQYPSGYYEYATGVADFACSNQSFSLVTFNWLRTYVRRYYGLTV